MTGAAVLAAEKDNANAPTIRAVIFMDSPGDRLPRHSPHNARDYVPWVLPKRGMLFNLILRLIDWR